MNDEASDKVLQIEVEYNQKRQPIYRERAEILRRLPEFWPRVLLQHITLRELITVEDQEALAYLEDVRFPPTPAGLATLPPHKACKGRTGRACAP